MIKKTFIIVGLLWVAFLGYLIFEKPIEQLSVDSTVVEPVVQSQEQVSQAPISEKSPPVVSQPEVIPFTPLPDEPLVVQKEKIQAQQTKEVDLEKKSELVAPQKTGKEDTFGLICTKFERVPSRFRLSSWDGTKKVEIEDLSRVNPSTKNHPKFWVKVRVPYKEFIHSASGDSLFKPTTMSDPNKRILAQSFEVRNEALSFTSRTNPIGYLILEDFKVGGPAYQITSEMDKPLTSSYYIYFEQIFGPQKFFHDLTGKRNGHPFGGWGFEYKITKQDFSKNKITVLRKDLKKGNYQSKVLDGPVPL